jgi:hypothetical protein
MSKQYIRVHHVSEIGLPLPSCGYMTITPLYGMEKTFSTKVCVHIVFMLLISFLVLYYDIHV